MPELSPAQALAVHKRGASLLLSAAAGSGKTRVLVERLMSYVSDPEDPRDIDSFLVITYTRAAAAELKGRIASALGAMCAADPDNRRLRRQYALSHRARIGTIHSYCAALLRENCHLTGLSPDFQVADEDRSELIRVSALRRLLEERYAAIGDDEAFRRLADTVGAGRDDSRLEATVLDLHDKMQSHPYPLVWLEEQRRALDTAGIADAGDTVWGRALLDSARDAFAYWAEAMEALLAQICADPKGKLAAAYGPSFSDTAGSLRAHVRACEQGWDALSLAGEVVFPRLGALRNADDPALAQLAKARREACKAAVKKLCTAFVRPSVSLLAEQSTTAPAMGALLTLCAELDARYGAEKRRRDLVDYGDLEHMALDLLVDPGTGMPTALAQTQSALFTQVMVDEYQDVNAVQEMIFRAVSDGGQKLFAVGDVKQSIYRFRLADPGIFLEKLRRLPDAREQPEAGAARILLRENYRSRGCVIDAVNAVFRAIMSTQLGELNYDDSAALRQGAVYPPGDIPARLTVLDVPEGERRTDYEARYVAGQIRSLMARGSSVTEGDGTRPLRYSDIAVLLRSPGSSGSAYCRALAQAGIPVSGDQGGDFFGTPEISIMLSLLAVMDNPRQDVALISVLRSPLFGFTADQLAAIRAQDKTADFYTALLRRSETDGACRDFLARLEQFRELARDLPADELLWQVYNATDALALFRAMEGGEARVTNLMLLYDAARRFEGSGYRGLFLFVAWLRRMQARGETPAAPAQETGDAVRIMSIHRAKGLEFPVVFLADTAHRFNREDTRQPVLVHSRLGLGPRYTDTVRRVEYPTLSRRAIAAALEREMLSEEMRVLYVALTRAREQLYISCALRRAEAALDKLTLGVTMPVSPVMLAGAAHPGQWLIQAWYAAGLPLSREEPPETDTPPSPQAQPEGSPAADLPAAPPLDWYYPHAGATAAPSKLTATELKALADREDDAEAAALAPRSRRSFRMPALGGSRPLTAAERSIAVHTVLQFIDLPRTGSAADVAAEILRLRQSGRLTQAQADAVDPGWIADFFAGPVGREILSADAVHREFRFSLLSPAETWFPQARDDRILLQGVIDCWLELGGEITVIDYKTDYVNSDTLSDRAALYAPQLQAYAGALHRITGKPVCRCLLYFLRAGLWTEVSLSPGD